MPTFILLAALLLVAAVLAVAIPLLRRTPHSAAAPWTALAVGLTCWARDGEAAETSSRNATAPMASRTNRAKRAMSSSRY